MHFNRKTIGRKMLHQKSAGVRLELQLGRAPEQHVGGAEGREGKGGPPTTSQFHHAELRPSLGPLPVLERMNVIFSIEVAEPMNIY